MNRKAKKTTLALYFFIIFFLGEFFFVIIKRVLSQFSDFIIYGIEYTYNISDMLIEPLSKGLLYGISIYMLVLVVSPLIKKLVNMPEEKQLVSITSAYVGIRSMLYILPWYVYQFKDYISPWIMSILGLLLSIPLICIAYILLKTAINFYRCEEAHILAVIITLPLFLMFGYSFMIEGFPVHIKFIEGFFSKIPKIPGKTTALLVGSSILLYSLVLLLYGISSKIFLKLPIQKKCFNAKRHFILLTLLIIGLMNYSSYFAFNRFILPKDAGNKKPDIIFVVFDALRNDYLSCNGYPSEITPNLDRISAKGYRYANFYSTANWSLPSYASMFTGIYPSHHRMQTDLREGETLKFKTLAETLKENGYLTALFTDNPFITKELGTANGFNNFYRQKWTDSSYTMSLLFSLLFLNERFKTAILDFLRRTPPGFHKYVIKTVQKCTLYKARHSSVIKEAKCWIKRNRGRGMPVFAFICVMVPHDPYISPALCANKFFDGRFKTNQDVVKFWYRGQYNLEKKRTKLYASCVNYADYLIGDFYNYLNRKNGMKNTLFIVTSDHGEKPEACKHDRLLENCVIKTPLIVAFPERLDGGTIISKKAQNVDFTPSILKIAGITYNPSEYQGLDTLFDKKPQEIDEGRVIVVEWIDESGDTWSQVIIDGDYKYMRFIEEETSDYKLYNLRKDPDEHNDIIKQNKDIAAALDKKLDDWMKQYAKEKDTTKPIDKKTRDLMKSLGYLQ